MFRSIRVRMECPAGLVLWLALVQDGVSSWTGPVACFGSRWSVQLDWSCGLRWFTMECPTGLVLWLALVQDGVSSSTGPVACVGSGWSVQLDWSCGLRWFRMECPLASRLALPITNCAMGETVCCLEKINLNFRHIGEMLLWWLLVMLSAVHDCIIDCPPPFKLRK